MSFTERQVSSRLTLDELLVSEGDDGDLKLNNRRGLRRQLPLHLMILPALVLTFIFSYIPMGGIIIAFQKFSPAKGLFGAQKWVGLKNFDYVFSMPNFEHVFMNTLFIAVQKLVFGFLVNVLVALLLNEVRNTAYKRTVQTIVYFPHFISWIIMSGILLDILSPTRGVVNKLIQALGIEPIYFLGEKELFPHVVVWTDIWKEFGFGTIIYLSAITGVDPTLYEAAKIDGAGKLRQTWHVTLPGIRSVMVLMMILSLGNVLNAGFDQIYNLLSQQVMETGDILDTLVYRLGLMQYQYSYATAVGLFKSVISMVLISGSYLIAYKFFDYRLF